VARVEYTKKIRRQQLESGQLERPRQLRHGPTGQLSAEIKQYLRGAAARQADLTLAEFAKAFAASPLGADQWLQPGHLVILDNLGAHKVDGVRQLIERCGASVLYLPP
jgi:hypothetical protein